VFVAAFLLTSWVCVKGYNFTGSGTHCRLFEGQDQT
jgi:hypothetical protein